jgi:hypothetical protein
MLVGPIGGAFNEFALMYHRNDDKPPLTDELGLRLLPMTSLRHAI